MADRSWLRAQDDEVRAHLDRELNGSRNARPHTALGVSLGASSDHVRAAFLEATKSFHPARFARRPDEIRSLANEVFLVKKEAYDQLISKAPKRPALPDENPELTPGGPGGEPGKTKTVSVKEPAVSPAAPVEEDASAPISIAAAPAEPTSVDAMQLAEFREAAALCDHGSYREARIVLTELDKEYPDNNTIKAHLHFARSGEFLERGRLRHAMAELKKALAADPSFAPAKTALAKLAVGRHTNRPK